MAILVTASLVGGNSASADECGKDLSPDEISRIVDRHLEQTIGTSERWPDKDVRISRHGCDYVYVEFSATEPVSFGDWFGMMIDQDGNVIDFQPGY